MKLKLVTFTGVVAVLAVLASTLAIPAAETTKAAASEQGRALQPERLGRVAKASEVLGMEIKNLQDEKLGQVEDLAIDVESGRVLQVLVSSGGILGMGDKVTAVPPSAFIWDAGSPTLRLDATKDKVKGAPVFEKSK